MTSGARLTLLARRWRFGDSECVSQKRHEFISTSLEALDAVGHEQKEGCKGASRQPDKRQVPNGQAPCTNGGDCEIKSRNEEQDKRKQNERHHANRRAMEPDCALESGAHVTGSSQSTAEEGMEGVSASRSKP